MWGGERGGVGEGGEGGRDGEKGEGGGEGGEGEGGGKVLEENTFPALLPALCTFVIILSLIADYCDLSTV